MRPNISDSADLIFFGTNDEVFEGSTLKTELRLTTPEYAY